MSNVKVLKLTTGEEVIARVGQEGDNIILAAFGGGFTWGSIYLKWAYDSNK